MVALTIAGGRRHIERRVYAATASGWRRLAVVPRVVSQSTVGLAQTWSGPDRAVVFTLDARPGARGSFRVLALRQRRWREVTHDWRTTFSPFRKGPVVTSDGALVALTEIHGPRGDFALVHLGSERSGRVFRRPAAGLAQGALSVTRSGSWIWWQDHILEPKGALRIDAYAGAVDACTGRVSSVQRFWHGRAAVPISAEIVELAGRPTVLYLKSGPDPAASPRLATVALRAARAGCR
jgi:hypothetical protein